MAPAKPSAYRIKPVTPASWKDMEALFEAKGGPKYCWCMAWRAQGDEVKHPDGKTRKRFLRKRVEAGVPVGLLAYRDGEPVGWCSVAPKTTFGKLDGLEPGAEPGKTWSITCFFVRRDMRETGLMHTLIDAAVSQARRRKARLVEAYPVDEDSPSYRCMGFVPVFAGHGFREAGRAGSRRHVMRLKLARAERMS